MKKYLCEFLGTCVLVLFGCGVAVLTEADVVATALAFGLSIVAVAYVIGNVSGCHVNPAVTFAMWIDKRISTKDFILYIVAQVLGAFAGCGLLILILNSTALGSYRTIGLGANTFGSLNDSGITMLGALITEIVLTFVFVLAVLGVTKDKKNAQVAPIVIGLTLALVHVLGIKLTGTSVNPARSLAPAVILAGETLEQVWVFIVGPLVGAAFAALASFFIDLEDTPVEVEVFAKEELKEEKKEAKKTVKEEKKEAVAVKVEKEAKEEKKTSKKEEKTTKTTKKTTKTTDKPKANKTTKKKN